MLSKVSKFNKFRKIKYVKQYHSKADHNLLLLTDVYKMGHMDQYVPGCNKVYSYLQARSSKTFDHTLFFGLQYIIKEYLTRPITHDNVDEFLETRQDILKSEASPDIVRKMRDLATLGYLPIKIKSVEEGSIIPTNNVLMTMTNTDPEFYWTVGFVESLLLKIWDPITVATHSLQYRNIVEKYFNDTVSEELYPLKDFMVHDFGYRGCKTEEEALLSGIAHLTCFKGSDTVPAYRGAKRYYNATKDIMMSVPASEHSVMCSFGRDRELDAYNHMLKLYPTGLVSIVSDTYSIWNVLTEFALKLKSDILKRDGKVIIRPDSGNPEYIICGDPNADPMSPEGKGCIRLLDEMFGSTINKKGYKELNPKVGLIYGDGMYLERYVKTLDRLKSMDYASSNLVIGVGGILRHHSRDTLGFAIKATKIQVNDTEYSIMKDPITDSKKKSHLGYLSLVNVNNTYKTLNDVCKETENCGLLTPVYQDGELLRDDSLDDIRQRINTRVSLL